ncbi:MAG: hypothetical protein RI575_05025 [Balneolaceae bacterium]|nr:hypothetical protein [Balneolaceae bacterium]MDR9407295.1 hypothetical protein [Balneolaceae bacterium]
MYKKGDRIQHAEFGSGSVLSVTEEGKIKIMFDDNEVKQLALSHFRVNEDGGYKSQDSFPDFIQKTDDTKDFTHGLGWAIFYDDLDDLSTKIVPKAIRETTRSITWSSTHRPLYKLPKNTPKRVLLNWPRPRNGIKLVFGGKEEEDNPQLYSIYPFASDGIQHEIAIQKIVELEKHGEAHLEVLIEDQVQLTLFDSCYVDNRGAYGPEIPYQFILYGFAYNCKIIENPSDINSAYIEKIKGESAKKGMDVDQSKFEDLPGATALCSAEDGHPDDYYFIGTVGEVEKNTILDRNFLKARTNVAGVSVEDNWFDFDLDIYVSETDLNGRELIEGDTIEGELWLQGYLWQPGTSE